MPDADPEIVRPGDIVPEAWANGLGITRVLVNRPAWRLSLADIDDEVEFSVFEGVDRMLMPLSAGGVVLEVEGIRRFVHRGGAASFRGEDRVIARVSEPVRVMNLMVPRAAVTAEVRIAVDPAADAVVVLVGDAILDGEPLAPGTAVLGAAVHRLDGGADTVVASLRIHVG